MFIFVHMPTAFLYVSLQLPALLKVRACSSAFFIVHFPHFHSLIWILRPSSARQTQQQKGACSLIWFVLLFWAAPPLCCWGHCRREGDRAWQCSLLCCVLPQGSLGEWVPVEVCLNAGGSICPRLPALALMDMSGLLIVELVWNKSLYDLYKCNLFNVSLKWPPIDLEGEPFVSEHTMVKEDISDLQQSWSNPEKHI